MTKQDIIHLAQVAHSLRSRLIVEGHDQQPDEQEFDQFIDRMLWAIRASHDNPIFDEQRFRGACKTDGFNLFDPPA